MAEAPANGEKLPWYKRLFEARETDVFTSKLIRDGSKWVLDLLRNIIIVGVLQYLATKSDSIWMKGISALAYAALVAYCVSYLQWFSARADIGRNKFVGLAVSLGLTILVSGILITGMQLGLAKIVEEIAKAQVK
jgi:hypothetical protein